MSTYKRITNTQVFLLATILLSSCNTINTSIENSFQAAKEKFENTTKIVQQEQIGEVKEEQVDIAFKKFSRLNKDINLKAAISNHPSVKDKITELGAARESITIAESFGEIQSSIALSGGYQRDDGKTDPGMLAQLSLQKLLYDDGAISSNVEATKYLVDAAEVAVLMQGDQVGINAYNAWIVLASQREILKIYAQGMEMARPLLGQIKNISTSGVADKASLLAAKRKFASLEMGYQEMKSNVLRAESAFLEYFPGADIKTVEQLVLMDEYQDELEEIETTMFENSKNLATLNLNILSTSLELEATVASAKPNLSLSASATAPAKNLDEDLVANVGLLVNYTFSDGGRKAAEIRALKVKLKSLELQKVESKLQMKTQLALLFQEREAGNMKEQSLNELLDLAKEVRDTAKAQLISGRSKIEDVMNAEVILAETEIDLIKTKLDLQMQNIKIETLVSGFTESLGWTP
jgi:outer membrane protein TolC